MNDALRHGPVANFVRGFFYPFRGARLLMKFPGLLRYVLIPLAINILVFIGAVYLGFDLFDDFVAGLLPTGEAWYWALLYYLLWVVAILVTAVVVFFVFTVVGNLLASPFNDLLSETAEQKITGKSSEAAFSWRGFWREASRVFIDESKKISVFVVIMLLLLLLNLVPAVGQAFYAVLSVMTTIFFLTVEYLGYAMNRHQLGFRDQRRFIWQRKFLSLGFGVGVLCVLLIPFLQFLCIPVSVLGGTLLFLENTDGPSNTMS
ncbi:MAG: sulfate transporter CysZ [Desulfuromonadales bacterium]|nr:sulfate transporter CysZ [Desulfuromonadales bacterium]NIS42740.1 sulfate transporter CysZ [Desulfuromonadales bacterium]